MCWWCSDAVWGSGGSWEVSWLLVEERPLCVQVNWRKLQDIEACFYSFWKHWCVPGWYCPLSSRPVLESCVLTILLYVSENWILTDSMVRKLEDFQGEWWKGYSSGLSIGYWAKVKEKCQFVLLRNFRLKLLRHVEAPAGLRKESEFVVVVTQKMKGMARIWSRYVLYTVR